MLRCIFNNTTIYPNALRYIGKGIAVEAWPNIKCVIYTTSTYFVHLLDDMKTNISSDPAESDAWQLFARCRASPMAPRNVGHTSDDGSWITYFWPW